VPTAAPVANTTGAFQQAAQAPGTMDQSTLVPSGATGIGITTQAGTTYTVVAGDANTEIEFTAATGITVTIPNNGTTPFVIGTVINLRAMGLGQLVVAGAGGVSVFTPASAGTRVQYSTISATKDGTNQWVLGGDLHA
jgi:hypothetical protein